jgi:hypothetical protein
MIEIIPIFRDIALQKQANHRECKKKGVQKRQRAAAWL